MTSKVEEKCRENLRLLWNVYRSYALSFGEKQDQVPDRTGSGFWLALAETTPPMIGAEELDVLVCPERNESPRPGFTTYRGPAIMISGVPENGPIGSCVHKSGRMNLLTKDGKIRSIAKSDKRYDEALRLTS